MEFAGAAAMKNKQKSLHNGLRVAAFTAVLLSMVNTVYAATLPGPADAGRIDQREQFQMPEPPVSATPETGGIFPTVKPPEGSKGMVMKLTDVHITGMTVFSKDDIKDIYAPSIGREITLDTVWMMADQLTQRYRDAGYLLSRAIVPEQKIDDGVVVLRVVEGYIGEVKLDDKLADNRIVKQWIDRVQSYRPVKADQIETVLLNINDIPGVNLHAVLEPMPTTADTEGAVRLVLEPQAAPRFAASVSFDNNGSRYLGPYEGQLQAQVVELPGQRTTLTGLTSLPLDEIKYGGLKHEFSLFPSATGEIYGSYTDAAPGYTLKPEEIKSASTNFGAAFDYSIIRQRQDNLSARIAFETQDTESDILGTPLTRDYIRALRLGLNYQIADNWKGQNAVNGTLSQGLPILGASPAGQLNLSRANATPDFTKFDFDASRLQGITDDWSLYSALSAQLASGPLYSSEQFGYGGQAFGRAYDNSEITGDQGIEGSTELRYSGIKARYHFQPVPYGFYDLGAVWNINDPTDPYASGSSAGAGVRLLSDFGLSGNFGGAFPLTRPVATPLYGNGKSPRYFFSLAYGF
jgi:hemolysin activation/secretion protein